MQIRAAVPSDVDAMAMVKTIGWATTYADLVPEHVLRRFTDVAAQRTDIGRMVVDPASSVRFLVAERNGDGDGGVVGEVVGYVTGDVANGFVDVLHVLPQWRSAGVGRLLLIAMARLLANAGCGRLWLHVVVGNVRAEKFYARLGGTTAEVEPADWAPGDHVLQTTYEWNNIHDLIALGSG